MCKHERKKANWDSIAPWQFHLSRQFWLKNTNFENETYNRIAISFISI
jgi:hypothetical protein